MVKHAFFLVLIILIGAGALSAQTANRLFELPKVDFKLTVEKNVWKRSEPAIVKIVLENQDDSKDFLTLPSGISFEMAKSNGGPAGVIESMFWSPVSLTKNYRAGGQGCRNDLSNDRVSYSNNSKIRVISPTNSVLKLLKKEEKEFTVDLNATCWELSGSSLYPSRMLFSVIDEYPSEKMYKVYFEMEFRAGTGIHNGVKYPMTKHIKSNQVEITVN